ncbi:MAG: ABC transporter substrate-binding protein [Rhizobiaceae bacterium]
MALARRPGHLVTLAFVLALAAETVAAAPLKRVVSMNVCTDQLAMLIARDGQLHSVSYLASDPDSSVLAADAARYAVNHGLAEEVFLMQPDLVIAGTYTTRTTVSLLRRLGVRVEEFAPESAFDDVRMNILRMGTILDRSERATELIAVLDTGLEELRRNPAGGQTVATYYANNFTSGSGTLVDAVIAATGLENLAARLGYAGTAQLPLELLILAKPEILVDGGERYAAPALAQQSFSHPAYRAIAEDAKRVDIPAKYTICGSPFTLEAARILQGAANKP